jgi:hypothetical protein
MISSLGQVTIGLRFGGSTAGAAARAGTVSSSSSGAYVEPRRPLCGVFSFETNTDSRLWNSDASCSNWSGLPSFGGKYEGPPLVGEETKFHPGKSPGLSESCGTKMDPPRGRRLSKGLASSSSCSSSSSSGVPFPLGSDCSMASSFLASRCDFCSANSRSSGEKGCEF